MPGQSFDKSAAWVLDRPNIKVHRCGFDIEQRLLKPVVRLSGKAAFGWVANAVGYTGDLIRQGGPDRFACLVSCAMPMYSHLVGLFVKRRFPRLPWIAHFADPWAETPYPIRFRAVNSRLRRLLEKRVLSSADMAIFVSDELKDFMLDKYGSSFRKKFFVLPHVFDPELYGDPVESDCNGILKMAYVGGLNKVRGVDPLCKVLKKLLNSGVPLKRFRLQLAGPKMEEEEKLLNDVHPGLAEWLGPVGYVESLHVMRQADCLLLMDANVGSSPFFPSKLADYLGSGRPVIGISPSGSCSSRILREQGYPTYDYDHLDQFAEYLKEIVTGSRQLPMPNQEKSRQYSAEKVATGFVSLVNLAKDLCNAEHSAV
jgi:glycosyltransferase involved in cell wall biosynthesis